MEKIATIQENRTYRLYLPTANKSADEFRPTGLAVWAEDFKSSRLIQSGDVVMPVAPASVRVDGEGIQFLTVKCEDGFVGDVCWDSQSFTPAD